MMFTPKKDEEDRDFFFKQRNTSVPNVPHRTSAFETAIEEEKAPLNITKVNNKAAAEDAVEREWCNFDIMARDFSTYEKEETYHSCSDEYGERYLNKRFDYFNILDAVISRERDMPWVLSLFGRGDHRFSKFDIIDFKVLDEEKQDCTDEQLASLFEQI